VPCTQLTEVEVLTQLGLVRAEGAGELEEDDGVIYPVYQRISPIHSAS
jgi:hypothetical protein